AGNRTQRACNFFRIVDTDPKETAIINPVHVEFRFNVDAKNLDATIVPNPASGEIQIVAKGFGPDASYTILSSEGRVLLSGPVVLGQKVDVSYLPEGLYYIRIVEGDKLTTKTFITTGQ
ncbi:MAG: T9SS type A sorting domain-containing protein, partial [Saprospiraceae bacterium]